MLNNKERDMTPFDRKKRPCRQCAALLPLVCGASWLMTRKNRMRIERIGLEGLRPPFLVYATHQGFSDYYIAPLALFPHRANYISDVEGFAAFGEGLCVVLSMPDCSWYAYPLTSDCSVTKMMFAAEWLHRLNTAVRL